MVVSFEQGLDLLAERGIVAADPAEVASAFIRVQFDDGVEEGLDLLFEKRKLEAAQRRFAAACSYGDSPIAAAARTSLALCYSIVGRQQLALFELRKVAYCGAASAFTVKALELIENILPTRERADLILMKGPSHHVEEVLVRKL